MICKNKSQDKKQTIPETFIVNEPMTISNVWISIILGKCTIRAASDCTSVTSQLLTHLMVARPSINLCWIYCQSYRIQFWWVAIIHPPLLSLLQTLSERKKEKHQGWSISYFFFLSNFKVDEVFTEDNPIIVGILNEKKSFQ